MSTSTAPPPPAPVISMSTPAACTDRLKAAKDMLDAGLITKSEFGDTKRKVLEQLVSGSSAAAIRDEAAAFRALLIHEKEDYVMDEMTKRIIHRAFDSADTAGDGVLSKKELCDAMHGASPVFKALLSVLQEAGFKSESILKRLLAEVDGDGDGLVYWGEFLAYFEDACEGMHYHGGCLTGVKLGKSNAHAHWCYQGCAGPSAWATLSKNYSAAKDGTQQSPINICSSDERAEKGSKGKLEYDCKKAVDGELVNNGHTLCMTFPKGPPHTPGTLIIKGKVFELAQYHFHASSEHTIDGKRYPLECHLVHIAADKQLAVVGILYKISAGDILDGDASAAGGCPFLAQLMTPAGIPGTGKKVGIKNISLAALGISKQPIYRYAGSLTTPPCSEDVIWSMFATPRLCSSGQLRALTQHMPRNNYRPTQPLNKRVVTRMST